MKSYRMQISKCKNYYSPVTNMDLFLFKHCFKVSLISKVEFEEHFEEFTYMLELHGIEYEIIEKAEKDHNFLL